MLKEEIRAYFKRLRSELSDEEVELKSKRICENFIQKLLPKIYHENSDQIFSLYLGSNKEVVTGVIAQYFLDKKIPFSYPKIFSPNNSLEFVLYEANQEMIGSKFYPKIFEPKSGKIVRPNILLLPLVAFDKNMSRIGMGAGFFDRTINALESYFGSVIKVGLAFDLQKSDQEIPAEKHDRSLDFIVTETVTLSQKNHEAL